MLKNASKLKVWIKAWNEHLSTEENLQKIHKLQNNTHTTKTFHLVWLYDTCRFMWEKYAAMSICAFTLTKMTDWNKISQGNDWCSNIIISHALSELEQHNTMNAFL